MLTSFLLILTKYLIDLFICLAIFGGIILCQPCLQGTVIWLQECVGHFFEEVLLAHKNMHEEI